MVDSSLEVICDNCGASTWYSGGKAYPESFECENCGRPVMIPEDG